jgi:uncharacterized protein
MIDVVERLEIDYAMDRSDFESAIEPLVDFDINTTELDEQADKIRQQLQPVAQQHQQLVEEQQN